ncbi:putative bifunctional diguanylate cyclase/phosphodiesterase [Alicyclobacillus shizuokensis]|uniref:putative bifunctional diguanylate cyclase/phosphodiesterase n=1 Tax=Alicyclobacillus shizuokensis TaxID=392014 RepID=UPI00082C8B08|nr:EAL domain-containing protein [Alicyclobacillus shizuokensis]
MAAADAYSADAHRPDGAHKQIDRRRFSIWLADHAPGALYCLDTKGLVLLWPRSAERLFGWARDEVLGRRIPTIPENEWAHAVELFQHVLQRGRVDGRVVKQQRRNGEIIPTLVWVCPIVEAGAVTGVAVFTSDNCESTQLYRDLEQAHATIERVVSLANIAIFSHDVVHNRQIFGTGTEPLYGYTEQEFMADGDLWRKVIHPEDRALVPDKLPPDGSVKLEYRVLRKDGQERWLEVTLYPRSNDKYLPAVVDGIAMDITERKEHQRRLQEMAYTDPLTSLPNQSQFHEDLGQAIQQAAVNGGKFGVLFVDFDGFKDVNDTFGHQFGDKVLGRIGALLKQCASENVRVYRMGGDEFTVLATSVNEDRDVIELARAILDRFRSPLWLGSEDRLTLHCSIGASIYPDHGDHAQALLRHADVAMYFAKESGGQRCVLYSPQLATGAKDSPILYDALVEALRREEFRLYYQPKIDMASGRLSGVEALIRWHSPVHGLVSPDGFIPVAEQSGLIWDIGNWVLEAACRQSRAWQEQGLPAIRVSVNVSMVQLEHPGFLAVLKRVLNDTGLNPRCLELEITESAFVNRLEHVANVIEQVASLGVAVSVDDFGVGYSSLKYLAHIRADELKVDQSFIQGLDDNPRAAHIVSGIIQMAHALGMRVVAEGVEREEQLQRLRQCGCDEAQGYLFLEPQPGEKFEWFYSQRLAADPSVPPLSPPAAWETAAAAPPTVPPFAQESTALEAEGPESTRSNSAEFGSTNEEG